MTVEGAPLYLLARWMCRHGGRNHLDASPVAVAIACCSSQMHRHLDQRRRGWFENCGPGGLCHSCMSGVTKVVDSQLRKPGFSQTNGLVEGFPCSSTFLPQWHSMCPSNGHVGTALLKHATVASVVTINQQSAVVRRPRQRHDSAGFRCEQGFCKVSPLRNETSRLDCATIACVAIDTHD